MHLAVGLCLDPLRELTSPPRSPSWILGVGTRKEGEGKRGGKEREGRRGKERGGLEEREENR